LERLFGPHFHELTLRLVAIAPSSDFVLPDNSIPQPWIRTFCAKSGVGFFVPTLPGVVLGTARTSVSEQNPAEKKATSSDATIL
jgi:hypothetical protein